MNIKRSLERGSVPDAEDLATKRAIESRMYQARYLFYDTETLLGEGGFGKIFNIVRREVTTHHDAVLKRQLVKNTRLVPGTATPSEAFFMQLLSEQPFSPTFYDEYRKGKFQYFIMEKIIGKDLNTLCKEKSAVKPCKKQTWAFSLTKQLYCAVAHLSSLKIHHGDLKLDNVMVRAVDNRLVLIDYGFMYRGNDGPVNRHPTTICTPPEVDSRCYGSPSHDKSDVWAMGIVIYSMLHGIYPYPSLTHRLDPLGSGLELSIDPNYVVVFSGLLRGTLVRNANDRWTLSEIASWIETTTANREVGEYIYTSIGADRVVAVEPPTPPRVDTASDSRSIDPVVRPRSDSFIAESSGGKVYDDPFSDLPLPKRKRLRIENTMNFALERCNAKLVSYQTPLTEDINDDHKPFHVSYTHARGHDQLGTRAHWDKATVCTWEGGGSTPRARSLCLCVYLLSISVLVVGFVLALTLVLTS